MISKERKSQNKKSTGPRYIRWYGFFTKKIENKKVDRKSQRRTSL